MSKGSNSTTQNLPFTEEWIAVKDMDVDPSIQRFGLDLKKVSRMVKNFNEAALGVVVVSRRDPVTQIILDGWHRHQTVKEVTENGGKMLAHVFEGLTRAQEAQLFLDLNAGNQPSLLEKFKARLIAEDPVAVGIDEITRSYTWTVGPNHGDISCIGALERIYLRSEAAEYEPNLLQVALLVVTRAWGREYGGVQAPILEGIASLYAVHTSILDLDRLVTKLQAYPGGPVGLQSDARTLASVRRGKLSMSVAELVTDEYNKGKTSKALPPWRKRKP